MGKLLVQKFGGTSLVDTKRLEAAADIIVKTISEGNSVAVVLSAMGVETDRLIDLAKAIHPEPNLREYDALVSTGEQISVALMAMALSKRNLKAKSYTAYQLGIQTNKRHGRARILDVKVQKLKKQIKKGVIPVITGFQGMNDEGDITTLGRGGSDTTGVAIAVALGADECQIFTDVDGVFTTDPRICSKARLLNQVSFEEMLEKRTSMKQELEEGIQLHEQKNEEQTLLSQKLQERQGHLENSVSVSHQESIRLTEFRLQREQLEDQLQKITEHTPEAILSEMDVEASDHKKMGQELRSLNESLNAMGAVNLAAPEEYAALTERIDFLKSQSEDLQKAVDDLKETIKDINIESRRRFREMFDRVNENFMNVFSSLFEGGEAKLVLTESEDLLNAGVDIVAQPPGKKLQNINLLSGGEKALTAISLIFAIFLVKPSPFCLLDEVDAPLDDVNVVRFNRLITGLSYDSQFIIVTHNKKTMEIGDLLYGVTMEEPGISKTVSVEFKEAESLIA